MVRFRTDAGLRLQRHPPRRQPLAYAAGFLDSRGPRVLCSTRCRRNRVLGERRRTVTVGGSTGSGRGRSGLDFQIAKAGGAMGKAYQVFVGCPFHKAVRKNYDRLKLELEAETPLHIVLADTVAVSSTDYLLEHITSLIRESAACIFDATDGNPNVSLEVGIAHAMPADFVLCLYTRRPRTRAEREAERALTREGEVRPIIADLQGRLRIEYKTYPALKRHVINRYLGRLPYYKRWVEFQRRHSSFVKPALQVFAEIRTSGRSLRARVIAALDGTGIQADDLLDALADAKLLSVMRGRYGGIYYPKV